MANYNKVSYGSDDKETVTKLQEMLNTNGAKLDVDGIFGDQTKQAVMDYQTKNGMDANGIADETTWSALTKASNGTAAGAPTAPTESTAPTFNYEPYKPSDTVAQAEALLREQLNKKPGDYTSAWQTQLNETLNKILNREKFSYDLNGDALYQQYKDQYKTQGQMAMMDTMGQAQAMTGGYGNSYAQSVGQQAYQGYLQQLNERVPELYQLALDQYNREGDELHNQASIMASMEQQDYGRYRDQVGDYYTELDRLTDDARYHGEQDYGKWADERNFAYDQFTSNRAYDYQLQQDQLARDEAVAQLMASVGDYSLLGKLYGLTDEQLALLKNGGKKSGSGPNPGTGDKCPKCGKLKSECVCEDETETTTYAQLVKKLKTLVANEDENGNRVTKQEISGVIHQAVTDGVINENQAQSLLKTYTPMGYTY